MKIFNLLAVAAFAQENDEGCSAGEIEVDGLCVEESYASEFANLLAEADNEQPENNSMQMRRFPLPGSSVDASDNLRTKKRTQRISLLMAQVDAKQRADPKQPKLRPREFLQKINGYGCHCWTKPGTEAIGYKGQPLDNIDTACKTLKSCHTCIELDYNNCDPVTTKYRAKVSKQPDGTLDIQCTNTMNKKGTNNGHCKRSLCECDKQFAFNVAESWKDWSSQNWDLEQNGIFGATCVTNDKDSRMLSSGPPNKCCGTTYPDMKPYSSESHTCTADKKVTVINNL